MRLPRRLIRRPYAACTVAPSAALPGAGDEAEPMSFTTAGPLQRAEAVINRARARHTAAICPGDARSPMDADLTVTVPRQVITACDQSAGDATAG